jgi:hypothetical protein
MSELDVDLSKITHVPSRNSRRCDWDFFPCRDALCDLCGQYRTGVILAWFPQVMCFKDHPAARQGFSWCLCLVCAPTVRPQWETAATLWALEQAG